MTATPGRQPRCPASGASLENGLGWQTDFCPPSVRGLPPPGVYQLSQWTKGNSQEAIPEGFTANNHWRNGLAPVEPVDSLSEGIGTRAPGFSLLPTPGANIVNFGWTLPPKPAPNGALADRSRLPL
jgi:hypothetical protein